MLATGTDPHASAHAGSPPGSWPISHSASGADSVSFHSLAGRMTGALLVERHHPVLLPGDADRRHLGRAGLLPRRLERRPPRAPGPAPICGGCVRGWGAEPRSDDPPAVERRAPRPSWRWSTSRRPRRARRPMWPRRVSGRARCGGRRGSRAAPGVPTPASARRCRRRDRAARPGDALPSRIERPSSPSQPA